MLLYLCYFQFFIFGREDLFKAFLRTGKFSYYFFLLRMQKTFSRKINSQMRQIQKIKKDSVSFC